MAARCALCQQTQSLLSHCLHHQHKEHYYIYYYILVPAASPMLSLGFRDKHGQNPAMQSPHTLTEWGRLVRPPKLRVRQCKMSRLQSLTPTAHSLLASTALSQPQGACLPEDLQLCLRIAKDSFILRNTK